VRISKKAQQGAKGLFRACLAQGLLDEGRVRAAVEQVVQERPRGYQPILSHFRRLVRLELERRRARVESVLPLSAALQAVVRESLTRRYGPGLSVEFGQQPGLVGGLRVQVGSDVFDGSIRGRLDALEGGL
jgi:F-type H+-transporting ATPase subunit delta